MMCFPSIAPRHNGKFQVSQNLFAVSFQVSEVGVGMKSSFKTVQMASHVSLNILHAVLRPILKENTTDCSMSPLASNLQHSTVYSVMNCTDVFLVNLPQCY